MQKVTVAIAALAAVSFAGSAMAETNPWHPDQTRVPVTITVETIAEVMTDTTPVELVIQNGGTNHGSENAVTRGVTYLSNANIQVSASIDTDNIPDDSSFLVLVDPENTDWADYTKAKAKSILRWTKANSSLISGVAGMTQHAFNAGPAANAATKTVQYFAYSDGPLSQDVGARSFNLVWTVAAGGPGM